MESTQFQSGFILDNLLDSFINTANKKNAEKLCYWLSHFDVISKSGFQNEPVNYSPQHAVISNLLQRGLPTRLNLTALELIVNKSPFLEWNSTPHSIDIMWSEDIRDNIEGLIFKCLHVIDPRINRKNGLSSYRQSWERLGSEYEEDFLYKSLPQALGEGGDFIIQLLSSQRSINSILHDKKESKKFPEQIRKNFEEQRTDFSIEFPYYPENQGRGQVIEIDGSQHNLSEQIYLDTERDKAVTAAGWNNTTRIKTSDFNTHIFKSKVITLGLPSFDDDYLSFLRSNYTDSLFNKTNGIEFLTLVLTPFAIARFQRILIEAIAQGRLSVLASEWNIAVLERDVPFAEIALEDFKEMVNNLNELSENKLILPTINLDVYITKEFKNCTLQGSQNISLIEDFNEKMNYDLVVDLAILQRTMPSAILNTQANEVITIRSVHYINSKRKIATSALINYYDFCNKSQEEKWIIDKEKEKNLEFFLKSIFRKKKFREGQLPIMHKALGCKSVIGLLPTGGGKSLTYQLSALLQPGICMVVDPIRSLMKDQVDGLKKNMIDASVFINSILKGDDKRKAMRRMAEGQSLFVFVSPERLQMEEFRILLNDMYEQKRYFSYCVIDEAHCVSEWGHDFRTAYLRLGENAMRFCKTANLETLPLFGLTATASYDVLADVQRELSGNNEERRLDEDAIVRSEFTKRDELQFMIEEVTFPTNSINNIWDLKKELGTKKQERLKRLLEDIPLQLKTMMEDPLSIYTEEELSKSEKNNAFENIRIKNFDNNSFYYNNHGALIFCPHTSGINGVTDQYKLDRAGMPRQRQGYYDILQNLPGIKAGFFMGSGNDTEATGKSIEEATFQNQDDFINSELNLMVATKAFGMGIDKENIRYTIHTNYPNSIENFVQEAGRAGRDGKLALSYILFNDQSTDIKGEKIDNDFETNMYFHRNSFKGIGKELAVLDELLTEIYFPDRTFEIENIIHQQLEIEVKCNYWERGNHKRLYVSKSFTEKLGYFDLKGLYGVKDKTVDPALSQEIFLIINTHISNLGLKGPAHEWIQQSDQQIGIETLLKSKNTGESFDLVVGFNNDQSLRIKTITQWLKVAIHNSLDETTVRNMRTNCTDADAFIESIDTKYQSFTGTRLDFDEKCKSRDLNKGNPEGTAYKTFTTLYNGYRDKSDTEKAIYRLSTLGIIDDYTVNFSSNTFTLFGKKKSEKQYKENLKKFLLKYYSEKTAKTKLKDLDKNEGETVIQKCLGFLVRFVYNEIQKKRQLAMKDMQTACRLGLTDGNIELKNFIDLYFNSKYARSGYSYINEAGEEVNASLSDITDNGKEDNITWVWKFIEIVDEDPKSGQIDNIKHLRGACTRMRSNQPDNYTLLLLNAFTLYMLEFKNPRFLKEAEGLLQNAFNNISEKESLNDTEVEDLFKKFIQLLSTKNLELKDYLENLDFNSIMIIRLIKPIKLASGTLRSINKRLN